MEASRNLGDLIVADDDKAVRDILSRALSRDFTVFLARDGTEAVDLLKTRQPVALLVDEMMPGLRGSEVLEAARELLPGAVRLLMTASTDFDAAVRAVNQGQIDRFFSKPLRPVELKRTLIELVEKQRREELLRVELQTLAELSKGPTDATVRVLLIGDDPDVVEPVMEACAGHAFQLHVETHALLAPSSMMQRVCDLVLILRSPGVDVEQLTRMARSVDETASVVLLDRVASLEAALEAHALGASDYLAAPFPETEELARRLERAAMRHVAQRDLRRLTGDLIVANRKLAESRRRTEEEQVQVLNAMINTLEARDPYTAGHTDRVAHISVRLSESLGHDAEMLERIRVGALLHDIGKIGVRDAVLLKPGRLDEEEFEAIKVHTTLGDELLRDISQFKCVASMIRHHHEKMDGSGYPDGLAGADIPIEARVVAVADVMDAITSTRPYRKGSAIEQAFEIMGTLAGHHLDAEIVDALAALHKEGRLADLLQHQGEEDPDTANLPGPYRS